MKNKIGVVILFLLSVGSYAQKGKNYFYTKNSTELEIKEIQRLTKQIDKLSKNQTEYIIELKAYTDNTGSVEYNKRISKERCEWITNFLVDEGFLSSQIFSHAIGMDRVNHDENKRSLSRRIHIAFLPKNKPFEELFEFSVEAQKYKFNPTKDMVFVANSGTIIQISANTLINEQGNIANDQEVELSFTEYRNPTDFMVSNIPMDYKNGFFHSGGMFDLQVEDMKGNSLEVQQGKSIDMQISLADTTTNFNFYHFDKTKKEWTTRNDLSGGEITPSTWKTKTLKETVLEMSAKSNFVNYSCSKTLTAPLDILTKAKDATIASLERYEDLSLLDTRYMKARYKSFDYAQTVKKIDGYNKDSLFTISIQQQSNGFLKIKTEDDHFPELTALSDLKIKANQSISTDILSKKWCDIRINHTSANNYEIELKGDTEFQKIKVQGFLAEELAKKLSQRKIEKLIPKHKAIEQVYKTCLAEKENAFNQPINKRKQFHFENRVFFEMEVTEDRDCFWEFIRPYTTEKELQAGKYEWFKNAFKERTVLLSRLDSLINIYETDQELAIKQRIELDANTIALATFYQEENRKKYEKQYIFDFDNRSKKTELQDSKEQLLFASNQIQYDVPNTYQSLKIGSVGLFNVDAPIYQRTTTPTEIRPRYITDSGEEIIPQVAYLVTDRYNSIFKFDGTNYWTASHFEVYTKNKNKLVVLDIEGNVYYFSDQGFDGVAWKKQKNTPEFSVESMEDIESQKELSTILKF